MEPRLPLDLAIAADAHDRLRDLAARERRTPRAQAAVMLERLLRGAEGGAPLEMRELPALAGQAGPAEAGAVHLSDLLLRGEPEAAP